MSNTFLSPRAAHWQRTATIQTMFDALQKGSLAPEERGLVDELCRFYMAQPDISAFEARACNDILHQINQ